MSDYDSIEGDLEELGKERKGWYEGGRDSEGQRQGYGEASHKNGDKYCGGYETGKRHGFGKYKFRNKARFEGEYCKGVKDGMGTFIYPDGSKYEGEWKAGIRDGLGKYTYVNGDWYDGSWKHNTKEGHGVYYHSETEAKYTVNQFSHNVIKPSLIRQHFVRMWSAGIREGYGGMMNNHFTYHGYFKNNNPYGPGTMSFNGCQQHGEYVLTDVFVRKNGMLETEQEPTWRCTELVYSSAPKESSSDEQEEDNDDK
ncbi:radial spoke head 1 homolog [Dendronephthya gigantea]|uniref:radial spoke head 1 homolog n=1 Tax=Dendronephthya gigantea TaxID=151771 RepID=UPI001068FEFF|nr:radial spoke head 1 homolog [Dendronephthya gigantea]